MKNPFVEFCDFNFYNFDAKCFSKIKKQIVREWARWFHFFNLQSYCLSFVMADNYGKPALAVQLAKYQSIRVGLGLAVAEANYPKFNFFQDISSVVANQ